VGEVDGEEGDGSGADDGDDEWTVAGDDRRDDEPEQHHEAHGQTAERSQPPQPPQDDDGDGEDGGQPQHHRLAVPVGEGVLEARLGICLAGDDDAVAEIELRRRGVVTGEVQRGRAPLVRSLQQAQRDVLAANPITGLGTGTRSGADVGDLGVVELTPEAEITQPAACVDRGPEQRHRRHDHRGQDAGGQVEHAPLGAGDAGQGMAVGHGIGRSRTKVTARWSTSAKAPLAGCEGRTGRRWPRATGTRRCCGW
jgi:hypothetical protein